MGGINGRVTPADVVLILGGLAFAIYLIQWQQMAIFTGIGTAAGAVALIAAVVVMPKALHRLAGQMTMLNNLLAGAQALGSSPAPVQLSTPPVVEGSTVPSGQVQL